MADRKKPTILICTACGEVATIPKNRDHRPLWAAGWRWIGSQDLNSCPGCPPVVIVGADGKHYPPGFRGRQKTKGSDVEKADSTSEPHPNQGA